MHNGVFADLETVVRFYDKYINSEQNINLETGKKWAKLEVAENISLDELKQGKKTQ
jgi:cytochrome c peroxidase